MDFLSKRMRNIVRKMSSIRFNSVAELREYLYRDAPEQKCLYCKKVELYSGWMSLCDRTCYYGLSNLLESYENGTVTEPDPRIVEYFKKYPEPEHTFMDFEKLKKYIKNLKLD